MPGMEVGLFPGSSSMEMGLPRGWGGQLANMRAPQLGIDLTEEENNWVVHADLPGFKDEDVELSIENGMLGVRAKRDKTTESDTGISHHVEVNTILLSHLSILHSDCVFFVFEFIQALIYHVCAISICTVYMYVHSMLI